MIIPHCLTIAGSDSCGGAGIQGDLKTFTVLGAYGMAVITALTAQNTGEVRGVHAVPADFVRLQLATVLDDIRCDAAKTGMLANADIVRAVAGELGRRPRFPLVADPVMVSTSGARLLEEDAVDAVRGRLLPLCAVATPNAPEAEILTGVKIRAIEDAERAARAIHGMGAAAVLVKGGDVEYEPGTVTDVLYDGVTASRLRSRRIASRTAHGSGCALASAICVGLARGHSVHEAVDMARRFVYKAIAEGRIIGREAGPVNHLCQQTW
ncbi:MAG: bifunctional hydroxymethylpyrimidine kinase/phosphomethylpyrimidine kinase [Candidatus Sumerlaeota bacterium]|nr:bifunctional hydroxymethylpyrimidine kinase/phosphomethylpyrimidine kinase [Candidatus Sumerlaeota bacterium]